MTKDSKNKKSRQAESPSAPAVTDRAKRSGRRWLWLAASLLLAIGITLGTMELVRRAQASRLPPLPNLADQPGALVNHLQTADHQARRNPASADAVGALGMAYESDNFYDQAAACYALAIELTPKDWRWHYYAALLAEELGDPRAVTSEMRRAMELNPNYAPGWFRLGEALFKQGEYEAAKKAYQRAIDADQVAVLRPDLAAGPRNRTFPAWAYGTYGLARVAVEQKQPEQAKAMLEALLQANPQFGPPRRLLGRALQEMGLTEESQVQIDLAGKRAAYVPPADPMIDALARQSCSSTFLLKLMSLASRGQDNDWAIYLGQRAVQIDPDDKEIAPLLARRLLEMGRAEEAIPYIEGYLKKHPDDDRTLAGMGFMLADAGKLDVAEKYLLEAMRVNPQGAEAHTNYGVLLRHRNQTEQAIEQYREAIRLDPNAADAYRNLGITLLQKGQPQDAAELLRQAVRIKPTDEASWGTLATIAAKQGQYEEVVRLYRQALQNCPSSRSLLNNLAWVLAACPQANVRNGLEAVALAERAYRLGDPDDAGMLDTLAAAHAEAGQFKQAAEAAAKAVSLAVQRGDKSQATQLQEKLQLYLSQKAYRDSQ